MRPLLRCYKQDKSTLKSFMRYSPASKDANTEAEGSTALEAVTRRQHVKHSRLRRLSACFTELLIVVISDSTLFTGTYNP
jgi:hypothetical protein